MAFKGAHIQPSCHAAVNPSQTICANEPGMEACANCTEAGERLFEGRVCMLSGCPWMHYRAWGRQVVPVCPGIDSGPACGPSTGMPACNFQHAQRAAHLPAAGRMFKNCPNPLETLSKLCTGEGIFGALVM